MQKDMTAYVHEPSHIKQKPPQDTAISTSASMRILEGRHILQTWKEGDVEDQLRTGL